MSIDEAIEKESKIAKENQKIVDTQIVFDNVSISELYCDDTEVIEEHLSNYKKCAEYHEQIAEWLEELKSYRASVFSGDMTQKMLKEEYCKAVDDFAESVKNLIADSSVIRFKDIDEISEQTYRYYVENNTSNTFIHSK